MSNAERRLKNKDKGTIELTGNRPFRTRVLYFGSRFVILKRLDTSDLILATFLMSNAERPILNVEVGKLVFGKNHRS
jgi:hypothetical protein